MYRSDGQHVLDLSILDAGSPQTFYLADSGLEDLADCFAVVGGVRLPLHSQVLAGRSAVLRDLFRSRKDGDIAAEVRRVAAVVLWGSLPMQPLSTEEELCCAVQSS